MSILFYSDKKNLSVNCYRNLNLLAHAQLEELDIGSRCGGHGICGGDRVKVDVARSRLSPLTEAEKEHLTQSDIDEGWRLACQCWPAYDDDQITVTTL